MTEEQRFPIDLGANLDVNSGDMLVKASNPLFSYNKQQYLGNLLQNSLRYERDGWFVGNHGYDFKLEVDGDMGVSPPLGDNEQAILFNRTNQYYDGVYIFKQNDTNLTFTFVTENKFKVLQGTATISGVGENRTIVGKTAVDKKDFTFSINLDTGVIGFTGTGLAYTFEMQEVAGYLLLNVFIDKNVLDKIIVRKPGHINKFTYRLEGNTSKWSKDGGDIQLVGADVVTVVSMPGATVASSVIVDKDTETEHVDVVLRYISQYKLRILYNMVEKWRKVLMQTTMVNPFATGGSNDSLIDGPVFTQITSKVTNNNTSMAEVEHLIMYHSYLFIEYKASIEITNVNFNNKVQSVSLKFDLTDGNNWNGDFDREYAFDWGYKLEFKRFLPPIPPPPEEIETQDIAFSTPEMPRFFIPQAELTPVIVIDEETEVASIVGYTYPNEVTLGDIIFGDLNIHVQFVESGYHIEYPVIDVAIPIDSIVGKSIILPEIAPPVKHTDEQGNETWKFDNLQVEVQLDNIDIVLTEEQLQALRLVFDGTPYGYSFTDTGFTVEFEPISISIPILGNVAPFDPDPTTTVPYLYPPILIVPVHMDMVPIYPVLETDMWLLDPPLPEGEAFIYPPENVPELPETIEGIIDHTDRFVSMACNIWKHDGVQLTMWCVNTDLVKQPMAGRPVTGVPTEQYIVKPFKYTSFSFNGSDRNDAYDFYAEGGLVPPPIPPIPPDPPEPSLSVGAIEVPLTHKQFFMQGVTKPFGNGTEASPFREYDGFATLVRSTPYADTEWWQANSTIVFNYPRGNTNLPGYYKCSLATIGNKYLWETGIKGAYWINETFVLHIKTLDIVNNEFSLTLEGYKPSDWPKAANYWSVEDAELPFDVENIGIDEDGMMVSITPSTDMLFLTGGKIGVEAAGLSYIPMPIFDGIDPWYSHVQSVYRGLFNWTVTMIKVIESLGVSILNVANESAETKPVAFACEVSEFTIVNNVPDYQDISIESSSIVIASKYDADGKKVVANSTTFASVGDIAYTFTPPLVDNGQKGFDMNISAVYNSAYSLYRAFILSATGVFKNLAISVADESAFEVNYNSKVVQFYWSGGINELSATSEAGDYAVTYYALTDSKDVAVVAFLPKWIYNNSLIKYISNTDYSLTFEYGGETYILHWDDSYKCMFTFIATDIRDNTEKEIYRQDVASLKQIRKQFWSNDVSTENYYYIDQWNVIEITFNEAVLWHNTEQLHDWNTNIWVETWREPKSKFIGIDDVYYNVSNANNAKGIFYKLQEVPTGVKILWCNVLEHNPSGIVNWYFVTVPIVSVGNGEKAFNDTGFCCVGKLIAKQITAASKSSVHIGDRLLLGFKVNKCLLQWTVIINLNSMSYSVLQGYGFVGVNGIITGNHLPSKYCESRGFNQIVHELRNFDKKKIVYGDDENIYFIVDAIDSMVSHYKFKDDGTISAENINLSSATKYTIDKEWASVFLFQTCLYRQGIGKIISDLGSDAGISAFNALGKLVDAIAKFASLPEQWLLKVVSSLISFANVYGISASYLWRTCEQHLLDVDITDSDSPVFTDTTKADSSITGTLETTALMLQITSNMLHEITINSDDGVDPKVNESQNQTSTSDKGRKFSNLAASMAERAGKESTVIYGDKTDIATEGFVSVSLDDYFKISSSDCSFSGPGFVNHNFIGQCNVSSFSTFKMIARSLDYCVDLSVIDSMSKFVKVLVEKAAVDYAKTLAGGAGSSSGGTSPGITLPLGPAIAAAIAAVIKAKEVATTVGEQITPYISQIFGVFAPKVGTSISKATSSNNEIEGRHTYGNRPVSLFYPAFGVEQANTILNEKYEVVKDSYTKRCSLVEPMKSSARPSIYVPGLIGTNSGAGVTMNNVLGSAKKGVMLTRRAPTDKFDINEKGGCYYAIMSFKLKGSASSVETLPDDMALVDGTVSMLPSGPFINQQIGVPPPIFQPPSIYDYCLNKQWGLAFTCIGEDIFHVSIDDTKVLDGAPSNIVISALSCCIASSYTCIEAADFDIDYVRPVAITPTALAINNTKMNCCYDGKIWHAFDGLGNRIVTWKGGSGFDKNITVQQQMFVCNKHFKRSNIMPPSLFGGNFSAPPIISYGTLDNEMLASLVVNTVDNKETGNSIVGENKNQYRFSIPLHTDLLSTLPAVVRSVAPYKLNVIEGITSLTTDLRNTQSLYKAPSSVDFTIGNNIYRATDEFVCSVTNSMGVSAIQDLVASVGLEFIGATTTEAYFYSMATRCYYKFNGSSIEKAEPWNRFGNITMGRWDFINQEVVFKCFHEDEAMICRLSGEVEGEIWTPPPTVAKNGDFKILSVAGGLVLQGPKRYTVNRFLLTDNMIEQVKANKGKWVKASREDFYTDRDYKWKYENWLTKSPDWAVKGWTHNAWELATAMLGSEEETDCKFEWIVNFCWTEQMEKLYGENEYITINLKGETITQGGTVTSEVTHLYLYKQMFTRKGINGYYSFVFQSNNGTGNRERLYMWSDGYIAIEDVVQCNKTMTTKRAAPFVVQQDVSHMVEQ